MSSGRTEWITDETGESFHENGQGEEMAESSLYERLGGAFATRSSS
jgi:hypothetical protein